MADLVPVCIQHSRRVGALSAAGANSTSTCSGAGAELWPGAPIPIVALRLLAWSPDAVALKAPLKIWETGEVSAKWRKGYKVSDIWKFQAFRILNCAKTNLKIQSHFSPFLVHTLFHPPEDLFWFYRSTGCQGGCTTVACKGRRCETKWENSNFELQLFFFGKSKQTNLLNIFMLQVENPLLLTITITLC